MYHRFKEKFPIFFYFILGILLSSCEKDWLEVKPDKALVVPTKISDYQALLDNVDGGTAPVNTFTNALGEIGAGDYYVSDDAWESSTPLERNSYLWASDIYGGDKSYDIWMAAYNNIFNANIVLEGIDKITPKNGAEVVQWNQVKGGALFIRAYRHYDIAQTFCLPFDSATAKNDLGIPLRLKSDISVVSTRSTVFETYEQIIKDLKGAASLLPVDKPSPTVYLMRPTKTAAFAMLARVFLSMRNYDSARVYSDKALQLHNKLIKYGEIGDGLWMISRFNDEVIFHLESPNYPIISPFKASVDSQLIKMYDANDRRKSLFFFELDGTPRFVGNYNQSGNLFCGLATDEMYLIRAECLARKGDKNSALSDLNTLVANRWDTAVVYPVITAFDASDALGKILAERRKELCFRSLRWTDLRRLNKDPQTATTLSRNIKGINYTLVPNDPKYVLPIPPDVILLTGMQQNPR